MNKAFTMIELIFVIVIIGILASVALPKLAASREDAQAAKIVNSLATCINDAGDEYMMEGSFYHFTQDDNATVSCRYARECFTFTETDVNGSLNIDNLASTDKKCIEAQRIASGNLLSSVHQINF